MIRFSTSTGTGKLMSFGIDRAIAKLPLKPGARQSRTAFIVQAVSEKLTRLKAEDADTMAESASAARPQ